jgi:hypothetical protein
MVGITDNGGVYRFPSLVPGTYSSDAQSRQSYDSVLTSAVDPGLDGFVGTPDDSTYGFYARISPANRQVITNDRNVTQTYKVSS